MSIYKYDSTQDELIPLAGGVLYADVPVGTIMPYGGSNPVDGFLLCQGQAVSRTTYSELFAVIGTSFGSGDGSTTFNVPDLRGEFLRGAGTNIHSGQGNGGIVGQHQDATTVPYFGSFLYGDNVVVEPGVARDMTRQYVSNYDKVIEASSTYYGIIGSQKVESGTLTTAGTVRPTNTSVNYIIKAKQVSAPADFAPVDVVENGNMKAVTSNAVYDAMNDIKTITPTPITGGAAGTVTWDSFNVKKLGKLVNITIHGMRHTQDVLQGTDIVTGLPKPALGRIYLAGMNYGDDGNPASVHIDEAGNLGIDAGFLRATSILYGSCSYISV